MPCLPGNRSTRHSGLLYKRFWATGPGPTALIPRAPQPIPGPVKVSGLGSCHVYKVSTCEVRGAGPVQGRTCLPWLPLCEPRGHANRPPRPARGPLPPARTHAFTAFPHQSQHPLPTHTPRRMAFFFFFLICTTQTTAGHEKATGRTANLTAHRMSGNGPPGSRWLSLRASGRSEESRSAPSAPLAPRPQLAR